MMRNIASFLRRRALGLRTLLLTTVVFVTGLTGSAGNPRAQGMTGDDTLIPDPIVTPLVPGASFEDLALPRRPINKVTEDMIKGFEQLRLVAYDDANGDTILAGQKSKGVLTIGWGHTGNVRPGDVCTTEEAERLFRQDIIWACNTVDSLVKVPLTENQFGALVCFTYNVGKNGFANSTLLRVLNAGDYQSVPRQLMEWTKSGKKVLNGLVRRRAAECYVFAARDIDRPVTLDEIMHKAQMIQAYNTSLVSNVPYIQALDMANRQAKYPYFYDQWWKDFYNNTALEHYIALLVQDKMGMTSLEGDLLQGVGDVSAAFNVTAEAGRAYPLTRMFGKNDRMRQVFDYVDLQRLALMTGTSDPTYQKALAKAQADSNPYLGLDLRTIYAELTKSGRTDGAFEIVERLSKVSAPWAGSAPSTPFVFVANR